MTSDLDLLRQFARQNSQAAFAELVRRHVNLVYSAALRQVRSPQLAEEVAQSVFIDLARNSARLNNAAGGTPVLTAWLYQVTRRTAIDVVRKESRRQVREQIAVEMSTMNATSNDWTQIKPLLDEAMAALDETDRAAVLLRYFENKNLREVGKALGTSDDAAQKRVSRAMDRLRELFSKRNTTIGASGLAIAISANAVQAAPAGLAVAISTTAVLAGATLATTATATVGKTIAMTTLQKTIITAIVAVLAGAGIYEAHQVRQLREQNQSLRQQLNQLPAENERLSSKSFAPTPHLPAPPIQAAAPAATNTLPTENIEATNFWARLNDKQTKLTREQAESFLKANGRNAANLLAAYRTSRDSALLEEAMKQFPNDPQVAFEAAEATTLHSLNLTPEEQRQWLDAFEKAAPNNSLANYLSAINYFNAGQIDEGVKELSAASGKTLDDYTVSRAENDVEVYLATGYSPGEAEQFGTSQLLLPQLAQFKQLTQQISDLANAYRQAGDATSAQAVLMMVDTLGQQYADPSPGEPTVSQLVGIAIEKIALTAMDPNAPYGNSGQTVQDRINQLLQQRTNVQQMDQQVENLLPLLTPPDLIIYKNRWLMFGEENAQQWVIGKYGQK
jgi:RNA polymerase sigma factor (sigma-70 family)